AGRETADGAEGADGAGGRAGRKVRPERTSGAELLTGNYFKVLVPSCPVPEREIVRVRIDCVLPSTLEGSLEVP
ncbi:MAG TPA: hypothetical protein VEG35_03195, partial [Burkholderiales bacterium]|nr:hypothetical protein [Burkholderiales bacterium]